MFAGRGALVKKRSGDSAWLGLLPSVNDGLPAAVLSNVVPKEGGRY
jgi:hypothetical protein